MPRSESKVELDERLQRILDEVSLAVRWQHPLLVTTTYRSEITRKQVATRLAREFQDSGQSVLYYRVDRQHYDIPLELKEHALHGKAIFFISNLRCGGGRGYSNAYRALNMHREYLVEGGIKAIFWLTELESRQIARFAPDFWAFRHLVTAFPELPPGGKSIEWNRKKIPGEDIQRAAQVAHRLYSLGCYDDAILAYRQILRKHPGQASIYIKIAEVQLSMGQLSAARRSLQQVKRGIEIGGLVYSKEYTRVNSLLKSTRVPIGGITEG